jgi:hypothetical protein
MFGTELKLWRQRLGLTHAQLARICNEFQGYSVGVMAQDIRRYENVSDEKHAAGHFEATITLAIEHIETDMDARIRAMKYAVRREAKRQGRRLDSVMLLCCRTQSDLDVLYPNEAPYGLAHHRAFTALANVALNRIAPNSVWLMAIPARFAAWATCTPENGTPTAMAEWFAGGYCTFPINPPQQLATATV